MLNRRRAWFWHSIFRFAFIVAFLITVVFLVQMLFGGDVTWQGTAESLGTGFWHAVRNRGFWIQAIFVTPAAFLALAVHWPGRPVTLVSLSGCIRTTTPSEIGGSSSARSR